MYYKRVIYPANLKDVPIQKRIQVKFISVYLFYRALADIFNVEEFTSYLLIWHVIREIGAHGHHMIVSHKLTGISMEIVYLVGKSCSGKGRLKYTMFRISL